MKRKVLSVMLASAMLATMFAGCGNGNTGDASGTANAGNKTEEAAKTTEASDAEKTADSASGSGSVYYLNFKPEQDQAWQDLAGIYTEQTGVPVTVITAADGTYEQTLKSEMAKSEAPTLFQVNGPVGLANWKDYCYDLSDSEICKQLSSEDFALKNDAGEVSGVAYVLETYGIIYNKKILNDYCTMDNAVISSPDEINSFDKLKAVADDIQARKDEINSQLASQPLHPQVWMALLTGDLRHILQIFQFTMNTKTKASQAQMRSREHTLIITNRSGIYTSQILPVSRASFQAKQVMKLSQSSVWKKQYSIRMVHGSMAI